VIETVLRERDSGLIKGPPMIPPATTPLIYLLSKRSPDGAKRHPGSARKHGPTASPGSTTYASARRHRKTMFRRSPRVGHFRPAIPDFAIARPEGRSRPSSTGYGRAWTRFRLIRATCSSGLLMVQRVILWRRANSVAIGDEADSSRIW